ncbi:hypothetical protein Cgig2_027869 [Carnegiea gigantea]|uniref:Suppressor of forked domain-containing protein n=1 Tax=Carnegiea gigantea TaxID=171969 RepID=A0A9Q1KN18_9CARY|nr:hypothetical protein Cgig2_027869 [Carnegiea gigantea]
MDRGKQRVVTELGLRASSSVGTQVYSRRSSVGNTRNRVRESKGSSSEGRVSVCANWPPDALLVRETDSPSSDEAKSFDHALFEVKICGQAFSNTSGSLVRDAIVSHQVHRGSVAKEKQIQRIRGIFHRHLSVPLNDMNSTLLAYKSWEAEQGNDLDVNSGDLKDVSSHVANAYKKALEMRNTRVHLEEQISKPDLPDSERISVFKRYLKFEESAGDPARVQILYERAITEFPITSDLWLDYTRYMDKTIKVGNVMKDIFSRATKNCPWIGELWVRYLLCLERGHASEEVVFLVFERALQCTFSSYEERGFTLSFGMHIFTRTSLQVEKVSSYLVFLILCVLT